MDVLSEGSKVTYLKGRTKEHGIIKVFSPEGRHAFVVFHCNNDWENYKDYTGQMSAVKDLKPGWI